MRVFPMLLIAALLLAGCSDKPAASDDELFDDIDADLDSGKGLIRGVVFDGAVVPIADAEVRIANTEQATTTTEEGAFLLANLDAGTYFLEVSKAGYNTIQTNAEVVADVEKPPIVRVQLSPLPNAEPLAFTVEFDGYIGCSVQVANFVDANTCGWIYPIDPDKHEAFNFGREDVPVATQTELVWEYTQTFGERLGVIQCMVDGPSCGIGGDGRLGNYWGTSPLICRNNATQGCGNDDGTGGGAGFDRSGFTGRISMNVYANCYSTCLDLRPAGSPGGIGATAIGLGVVAQQSYSAYGTVFYNIDPDAEWTFYEDGHYELP